MNLPTCSIIDNMKIVKIEKINDNKAITANVKN